MNEITMTVTGWVATEPRHVVGPTGTALTSFRLATTARFFNREAGRFEDGRTEWFTVRTFRQAAINVRDSIDKGQPVVVTGRFSTHEWDSDTGVRVDLLIDATSVGHDLSRGVATFTRSSVEADAVDAATSDV